MTDTTTIILTPPPLTPLIGRDGDLASLLDLLRGSNRFVTLTGIGGIGKTRLAHQVALELEPELAGGTVVVPLVEIRDASLVPAEIAKIFGRSDTGIDTVALAGILGEHPRLLVLDNLEQIPDAGEIISELLQQLPALIVLGTSQIPLDVAGEQLFPLEPMALGRSEEGSLRESPAIELFLHRAKQVDPRLEFADSQLPLVAEICQLLDGIPLAIELAAARLSIFSLQELRKRLTDQLSVLSRGRHAKNERHRTMRNAIAWSYDLLDVDQKRLFRYLGVYAGGMSVDAIQHTLTTLEIAEEPLDIVSFLVSRGLIRRLPTRDGHTRYQMLQTLREFAQEQLIHEGDEFNARLAHATYVVEEAEEAESHLTSRDQVQWSGRLRANLDNIRTACEWSLKHRPEIVLRIIAALPRFLEADGSMREFVEYGLVAVSHPLPDRIRARGCVAIGSMRVRLRDDHEAAEELLSNGLELARRLNDPVTIGQALIALGTIELYRMDLGKASTFYDDAATIATACNDAVTHASALGNQGLIEYYRNDWEAARDKLQAAARMQEEIGDLTLLARVNANLGLIHNRLDEFTIARDYLTRAVIASRAVGNTANLIHSLLNLGNTNIQLGDEDAAQAAYQESIDIAHRSYLWVDELESRTASIEIELRRNDLFNASRKAREALSLPTGNEGITATCVCAGVVMLACIESGKRESAAALWGAISAWAEKYAFRIASSIREPGEALYQSFAVEESSPEMMAWKRGRDWSKQELASKAIQLADEYILTTNHLASEPTVAPRSPVTSLTPRELEVLRFMTKGHSNKEIADEMFISTRTITTHISNIFAKLEVKNRSSAIAIALSQERL